MAKEDLNRSKVWRHAENKQTNGRAVTLKVEYTVFQHGEGRHEGRACERDANADAKPAARSPIAGTPKTNQITFAEVLADGIAIASRGRRAAKKMR
ncbi:MULTISPECIES: hypothetical protein [unclassified Martelella]|uniref:hypothetical protein n=1 Tax=unclassified Martelella TaxID=2629616 RepID=UPI0025C1D2F6|nr:hypothetical protein [Martelella sp.]